MTDTLQVKEVSFSGDMLLAAQDNQNKIWVAINWICKGIGLSEGQMKNERQKVQSDLVLSRGGRNLVLPTNGNDQETVCILIDFLPLWLAKISITPAMRRDKPALVEKLIQYQLKVKDVLAAAFLSEQLYTPENEVLKQLQQMQTQINAQGENFKKLIAAKNEEITTLETEVFKHPLSEKTQRVLARIKNDYNEELKKESFIIAFDWLRDTNISEKREYVEQRSNNDFYKNYVIQSFQRVKSDRIKSLSTVSNIQYSVTHTVNHAKFLLAVTFLYYYYQNSSILADGYRQTRACVDEIAPENQLQLRVNDIMFYACVGNRRPCILSFTYEYAKREYDSRLTIKEYLFTHDLGIALIHNFIGCY